jgi:hypothetical protein
MSERFSDWLLHVFQTQFMLDQLVDLQNKVCVSPHVCYLFASMQFTIIYIAPILV